MKRSALVLALAPLLLLFALGAAGDEDPEECQRYSAEEFKTTMFQRVVGMNLHLLRETLFQGTDGILELLDGVGDRNPGDEVVPRVKEVVKKIKPETTKIFMELFMAYEKKWAKVLEEAEEGGQQSFEDIRLKLQRIHTVKRQIFKSAICNISQFVLDDVHDPCCAARCLRDPNLRGQDGAGPDGRDPDHVPKAVGGSKRKECKSNS